MILSSVSDLIRIITASAVTVDVQASWSDQTTTLFTPGRTNTAITTATTTTVVGSPAASTQRLIQSLKIKNKHAASSNLITVEHYDGATAVQTIKYTLLAGEMLQYDGRTWQLLDATGAIKTSAGAGGSADGLNRISAGTQIADTLATVSFADSNGISFGLSDNSVLTAAYSVPVQSNGILDVSTATQAGTATSRFAAHDHQHRGVRGVAADGTASTFFGNLVLSAAGAIILATGGASTAGSIQISAPVQSNQTQSNVQGIIVSDTTYRTGDVSFKNGNGISFGSSGANIVTASYTVPVVPAQIVAGFSTNGNTAGDTGLVTGRLNLIGGNNVTLSGSTNGGSISVTISGPNTAAQFSGGFSTGGNTAGDTGVFTGRLVLVGTNAVSLSGSSNGGSATISINVAAQTAQTQSNVQGIIVSDTTYRTGDVSFKNANGISFGSSGANIVTASYTVPAQSNQTLGIYNSSQTTGASSSSTYDARSLSIVYSGIISGGWSNSSLVLNVPAGAGQTAISGIVASDTTYTSGTVSFSNQNGVTIGSSVNGATQYVRLSVATSYAASDHSHGNPTLALTNLSGTTASASNGLTLSLSAAARAITLSGWRPEHVDFTMLAHGQNSLYLEPRVVQNPFQYDRMVMPFNYSQATNSTLTVSNSVWWGLYTRNADTLSLHLSGSGSFSINGSGTASSGQNSGLRIVSFGSTQTVTENNYVFALAWKSTTAGADASLSHVHIFAGNTAISGYIGLASGTRMGMLAGRGVWTSTTSGMPNSVAMSDIRGISAIHNRQPIFYFTSGEVSF